jgi:hypothetical protein
MEYVHERGTFDDLHRIVADFDLAYPAWAASRAA